MECYEALCKLFTQQILEQYSRLEGIAIAGGEKSAPECALNHSFMIRRFHVGRERGIAFTLAVQVVSCLTTAELRLVRLYSVKHCTVHTC